MKYLGTEGVGEVRNGTKITLCPDFYQGHLSVLTGLEISLPHLITPETTLSIDLKHNGGYYHLLLSIKC